MARKPQDDLHVTPPPRLTSSSDELPRVSVARLQTTLDKVVSAVNRSARHTAQIPEIKEKVDSTSDKVIQLDTKMDVTTERVTKIEDKVDRGHDCVQVDIISALRDDTREHSQKMSTDVNRVTAHGIKLDGLKKEHEDTAADVEDIKKAPRRLFYGLVGLVLTVSTLGGGALWFLAELNKDVEFERTQRTQQFKRIEKQMRTISSKADNAPVTLAIEELADEVQEGSNGRAQEFDRLCVGMQPHERRFMKSTLLRRGKRVPQSCLR